MSLEELDMVNYEGNKEEADIESIEGMDTSSSGNSSSATTMQTQTQSTTNSDGTVPFGNFASLDLRVAEILSAEDVPGARKPLYKLNINLGELGNRYLVAGIGAHYTKEELIGRRIIVVANLEPKAIAGITSQGMLLAAEDNDVVSLLQPDRAVKPGCKIG